MEIIPWNRSLSDVDINNIVMQTPGINKYFRGIISRDKIISNLKRAKVNECGIINLDNESGPGTHYTAYFKKGKEVYYYDSFGNLPPPKELIIYLKKYNISYNQSRDQEYNSVICGQLCLCFLYKIICENL